MNKEITDCDGKISIPFVKTVYEFCKLRLTLLLLLQQKVFKLNCCYFNRWVEEGYSVSQMGFYGVESQ